jgi:GntR family transcriptional repressor for pyruvate dehydrogenase complex
MSEALAPIRPYRPDSRIEEVEARIREYITNNSLEPGHRLPGESWFAEQLEVGRPLIREAMKGLEAVGMIEVRKGVGRFVRAFDPDAYLRNYTTSMLLNSFSERELAETRCLLEISMAADAIDRLTDADLLELAAVWKRLEAAQAADTSDPGADLDLHRLLMRRADNRVMAAILDAIYAMTIRRNVAVTELTRRHREEDFAQHAEIVRAAERRDGQAARAALVNHFRSTASRLGFELRWRKVFAHDPVSLEH